MVWSWFIIGAFIGLAAWYMNHDILASLIQKETREQERKIRHARCLARIAEIEADALMPLNEWLEREMARRKGQTAWKDSRPTMAEAHRALMRMVGYAPEPTAEARMLAEARRQRIAAAQQYIASEREEPNGEAQS